MSFNRPSPDGACPASESPDFGPVFDAFPVESPFEVRPDLAKMTPPDDWLRVDGEWPAMVAAKLAALGGTDSGERAENIMLAMPCDGNTQRRRLSAIKQVASNLAATGAGRRLGMKCAATDVAFTAAGYRCKIAGDEFRLHADRPEAAPVVRALETGVGASGLLGAIAMSLQEDLVLMEQAPDGVPRAAVFHVSFPSAWNPAAKLGQDLLALHAPVADNALLQSAASRLGRALLGKGPFVRWVWTVTVDPRWRAWPPLSSIVTQETAAPVNAGAGSDPRDRSFGANRIERARSDGAGELPLYFRLERQTTMPLDDGYGLFLIRVQVRPLADVLARQPERLALLQASLRSMSDAMVSYKSLGAVRDRVLQM